MADKEKLASVLRAVLISYKGAATLKKLSDDYRELEGKLIPYKDFGYRNLEEFLKDLPGIKFYKDSYGEIKVDAIPTENTRHIAELVARQKSVARRSAPKPQFRAPWKQQSGSNGYKSQMYKQATPYRSYHNNNSNHTYNQNYNSYKSPQPAYKSSYKSTEIPKRSPPERTEVQRTDVQRTEARPAPPKSVKLAASSPAPAAAAAAPSVAKVKPSNERKNSQLTLAARMQGAILADEADNPPAAAGVPSGKRSKALGRMSSLRDSFANHVVPLPLPAACGADAVPAPAALRPAAQVSVPAPAPAAPRVPDPPPPTASSQEKLNWMCLKLNLPTPSYKMCPMKEKKGPLCHFCVAKVGESYSAMTYPAEPSESEAGARELAARKLLKELEGSESRGLATTERGLALARLATLVDVHECGLWAGTVPHLYREKFKENLPTNWQELVEASALFGTERGANGQLVILPQTSVPVAPTAAAMPFLGGGGGVGGGVVGGVGGGDATTELPQLQLPEEPDWNVFVTTVNTTMEVWLRLIGDEYSSAYHTLLTEMESYYSRSAAKVASVQLNTWYAVNLEEGWHRALAVELLEDEAVLVFLGDHGDEEAVPAASLRPLAPHFAKLPAQAILCRLDGMEELGGSELGAEIVRRHLVGQVLVAVPAPPAPDEPSMPVVLFRTVGVEDVNVNLQIFKDFCALGDIQFTEKVREVEVGCVSAEGSVWVVSPAGAALVRAALQLLTSPGPYYREPPAGPALPHQATPNSGKLYMVRTHSGEWLRCTVRAGVAADGSVSTRLVDSGQTMRAPFTDLKPIANYSEFLACFPPQARAVRLGSAERAAPRMVPRLRELLLGVPVLCRALPPAPAPRAPLPAPHAPAEPDVELFVRSGPQSVLASVNSTILFEYDEQQATKNTKEESKNNPLEALNRKKERIFRSASGGARAALDAPAAAATALPPAALPACDQWVNLYVTMAANPWNFVVQVTDTADRKRFTDMMAALQTECPKLAAADHPSQPAQGELYTVLYESDTWYRVVVANVVSQDMVSIYFCDFGDLALVSASELRRVPDTVPVARLLPPQAIRAKLYGVAPLHQDWSVEDCIRFQELCVYQEFAGKVCALGRDPLNPAEPLLTVDLVDTSTAVDLYLNRVLQTEGRAELDAAASSPVPAHA